MNLAELYRLRSEYLKHGLRSNTVLTMCYEFSFPLLILNHFFLELHHFPPKPFFHIQSLLENQTRNLFQKYILNSLPSDLTVHQIFRSVRF